MVLVFGTICNVVMGNWEEKFWGNGLLEIINITSINHTAETHPFGK